MNVKHLLFALSLAGCGSPGDGGMPDAGADLAPPPPDMRMNVDLGPCGDPLKQRPDGGVCLLTVDGTLVDEQGAPVKQQVVSVCAGICYFGKTGDDGAFVVKVYHHVIPSDYALEIHGRPDGASYYVALPTFDGDHAHYPDPLPAVALPASGPPIAEDMSAQKVTSGDVTLILDLGTEVTFDPEDLLQANGKQLRARTVDAAKVPFCGGNPPLALYGFEPFDVVFSQKAHLSFVNTTGLPANAAVDVLGMTSLISSPPPAGVFAKVASAHVSADGTRVDTDPGEGVTTLTWIELVAAQ